MTHEPGVPETELSPRPQVPPQPNPEPRQPAPPRGLLRVILQLPVHLYHAHLGALLGNRFLLLVHTGRRTGVRRETVVEVVHYDRATQEAIVTAGWGVRTQWLHNVEAGLATEVWIGRRRFVPLYRVLATDEAVRVFADYERRNRLAGPIVRAVLSRLVGWRYDGTPAARRRVVEQLRLVAFRPAAQVPAPGASADRAP